MTRDQMIAWLTLEGWEPIRVDNTGSATLINFGKSLYFGHFYFEPCPLANHTILSQSPDAWRKAEWNQFRDAYFVEIVKYFFGEQT